MNELSPCYPVGRCSVIEKVRPCMHLIMLFAPLSSPSLPLLARMVRRGNHLLSHSLWHSPRGIWREGSVRSLSSSLLPFSPLFPILTLNSWWYRVSFFYCICSNVLSPLPRFSIGDNIDVCRRPLLSSVGNGLKCPCGFLLCPKCLLPQWLSWW